MKTKMIVNKQLSAKARKSFKERGELMPPSKVVVSKKDKARKSKGRRGLLRGQAIKDGW